MDKFFIRFILLLGFSFHIFLSKAETRALSDDPDFIKASLLITDPGYQTHQIFGHAVIRMECPQHGLDRVFSFDNDAGSNVNKLFIEGAHGKVDEIYFDGYLNVFKEEGREIKSYPLNLTLNQKARLWQVLDSLKTLPEIPFNIADNHCFAISTDALDIALKPAKINWNELAVKYNSYANSTKDSRVADSQWNYLMILLLMNTLADTNPYSVKYFSPINFETYYPDAYIVSENNERVPLIDGEPEIITPRTVPNTTTNPTPTAVGWIILGLSVLATLLDLFTKTDIPGRIIDILFWVILTVGGFFILFLTYAPFHYGGNWSWPLIVFNPIAWIPVVIFRNNKSVLTCIWGLYAFILICFAVFIDAVTETVIFMWILIAIAFAIRCAWHCFRNVFPNHRINIF